MTDPRSVHRAAEVLDALKTIGVPPSAVSVRDAELQVSWEFESLSEPALDEVEQRGDADLEAELEEARETIAERDDTIQDLKDRLQEAVSTIEDLEAELNGARADASEPDEDGPDPSIYEETSDAIPVGELHSVGDANDRRLQQAGIYTASDALEQGVDGLEDVNWIGPERAETIVSDAREQLNGDVEETETEEHPHPTEETGYPCPYDDCDFIAASENGLGVHKNAKHVNVEDGLDGDSLPGDLMPGDIRSVVDHEDTLRGVALNLEVDVAEAKEILEGLGWLDEVETDEQLDGQTYAVEP